VVKLNSVYCAALLLVISFSGRAEALEKKPDDPFFEKFHPLTAPATKHPVLHQGDRLAICGDSITEQRMYSRIMATYLAVTCPQLEIDTRQYGWSGEQASGFLARMTNDVLRFHPTVATTCYGMNDHHYRKYEESIGQAYRSNMQGIIEAFKSAGTKVVIGAPGCMGLKQPPWGFIQGTPEERNLNLCNLRNIDVELAQQDHEDFADVFWTMYKAEFVALHDRGTNYNLAGADNVHPNWAGHLIMAYAFLKALDVDGDIGTIQVNLHSGKAKASHGHEVLSSGNGAVTIKSYRYPFCATGRIDDDKSIRSGMTLVPFNQELNRFILVAKGGHAAHYKVTWGEMSRDYTPQQLKRGINLADDFPDNPFLGAFRKVDEAVAAQQAYETKQIKELFHGAAGKADMEKTAADSERERASLVAAVHAAFVPVTHTLSITPD
jgi:lysophospholipase L1-like esterase